MRHYTIDTNPRLVPEPDAPAWRVRDIAWINYHNGHDPRPEGIRNPPEMHTHKMACQRVKVSECPSKIPTKWIEALEQNQQISSCCRHPENHDIMAFHSPSAERVFRPDDPSDPDVGRWITVPDIYMFICDGCQRIHRRPICGGGERIAWEIR